MPIYAYRCESCGFGKDVLQKMSDAPLSVCPECGKDTFRKQVTAAGFQLKGSGWYVTDFRGGNTPAAKKGDDGKSAKPDGDAAAGNGDAGKSDAGNASGNAGAAKPDSGAASSGASPAASTGGSSNSGSGGASGASAASSGSAAG